MSTSPSQKRFVLVTLRRGRKKAILTGPGGALWEDFDGRRPEINAVVKQYFALGWTTADYTFFYTPPERLMTRIIIHTGPAMEKP